MSPAPRRTVLAWAAAALAAGAARASGTGTVGLPPPPPPQDEAIRALLQQRIAEARATGLAVVVVEQGRVRQVVAGVADTRDSRPVDRRTRFELGSITKPLTATLAARLADAGRLSLDDPVVRWVPALGRRRGSASAVRVQDLVTHRSGLPRLPNSAALWWSMLADPADPYARIGRDDLDAWLEGWSAPEVIPAPVAYSNLGYAVLGRVVEVAAGRPYAALLADQLLTSAGLERAGIARRDGDAVGTRRGRPVPSWALGEFAAAGGLRADADDVARLLQALLRAQLPFASRDFHPRAAMRAGDTVDGPGNRVALGWIVRGRAGAETVWHNGGTGGFHAWLGFSPSRGVGVAVLASGDESVDELGWRLMGSGS